MENNEVFLKLKNVYKIYKSGIIRTSQKMAANNISFELSRGEVLSIVGESGSGKSTAAKMILRLLKPTRGEITLNGRNIYSYSKQEYYKKVQVIFQDPYGSYNLFYRIERVLYNAFNLKRTRLSKIKKKVIISDVLNQVGLNADEVLGRYPHQLSGGQLQRFLIARTLIIKPELLVADEATSMIDASSRAGVLNLFEDLRKDEGLSIMFITHDIGQAQYISDRVLIMKEGEIVERGTCDSIFTNPQHAYTKDLLSCVPVLHGRWDFLKSLDKNRTKSKIGSSSEF